MTVISTISGMAKLHILHYKFNVGWGSLSTCILHCCAFSVASFQQLSRILFCSSLFGTFCLACQAYKSSYILVVLTIVQGSIQWEVLVSKFS